TSSQAFCEMINYNSSGFHKLFYHGNENEDIEDFIFDFEMYAESKQWDDNRKKKVVSLHVADKTTKTKFYVEEKVARLMRIKQKDNESVVGYFNRFESLAYIIKDEVEEHFSSNYNEVTNLAVKIKRYNKDNEYNMQRVNKMLIEGMNENIIIDIEELTRAMETLKIL
ncbi:594_t:CDS:2, partial [Scutellospora calospora]